MIIGCTTTWLTSTLTPLEWHWDTESRTRPLWKRAWEEKSGTFASVYFGLFYIYSLLLSSASLKKIIMKKKKALKCSAHFCYFRHRRKAECSVRCYFICIVSFMNGESVMAEFRTNRNKRERKNAPNLLNVTEKWSAIITSQNDWPGPEIWLYRNVQNDRIPMIPHFYTNIKQLQWRKPLKNRTFLSAISQFPIPISPISVPDPDYSQQAKDVLIQSTTFQIPHL